MYNPKPEANIPLSEPFLCGNEWKYVKECLDTAWVSYKGEFVDKFEEEICKYTKARYAVACQNGTAGLHITLKLAGVGSGDEVIVPTLTFIASINPVKYLDAEPVFMDCDEYQNIDVEKLEEFLSSECEQEARGLINKQSGRIIKAIVPVHIFGNPCNMGRIMELAKGYGLKVVEDAAESLGSFYTEGALEGKHTGTVGDLGVYSFNGNKIITSGGGGMIVTGDERMAKKAKYLTTQAKDEEADYIHNEVGYNYRLTNLQAALGLAQLEQLERFIKLKKNNYEIYQKELRGVDGIQLLGIPEGTRPNYWLYSILIDEKKYGASRDDLRKKLENAQIQTRPVWQLNHLQKPYLNQQAYKIEKAIRFRESVLNLPCSVNLSAAQVKKIVREIKKIRGAR